MLFEHLFSRASASPFEFVIHLVDLHTNLFAFLKPSFVSIFSWKQHTGDDAVKTPFLFRNEITRGSNHDDASKGCSCRK